MLKKFLAVLALLCAATAFAADVNKASAADLDDIKGIGPGLSTRILDERKKGPFKDWADFIARIKGIGEGNAQKFSDGGLTINGAPFKPAAARRPASAPRPNASAPRK
jgi:competence protein ComEA